MQKILIINPPFYRLQEASLIHYPPGCCYMAAALEKAGFPSLIYNADYDPTKKTIMGNTNHLNVEALTKLHAKYEKRLHSDREPVWKEIFQYLKNSSPNILIISVFNTTLTAGERIAKMAKEINPKIVTIFEGWNNRGLHCAVNPAESVSFKVMDFAIRKEPEETVVELVKELHKKMPNFTKIKGLSWKNQKGKIIHNTERPPLSNLDKLPFPARHLIDGFEKMPPQTFLSIYGSRGCPFDCTFCGCHISMGYKPRLRSAENMVKEIEETYKKYHTHYFYLCDDIFFINKERSIKFCQLLIKKHLPIYWSCQTRAEMVDLKILKLAKKAGCQHVSVGVEVGNPHIRTLIKKGNTIEDVRRCAEIIHQAGLRMVAFCLIGLPWEGQKEIEDTVNLVKEIKPHIVYPYLPTPASGTELAQLVLKKNPQGFAEYRDQCHDDTSAGMSEKLSPQEKKEITEWALNEFVKINKHNLAVDLLQRPKFYWALASDLDFFRHPKYFFGYIKDYLNI